MKGSSVPRLLTLSLTEQSPDRQVSGRGAPSGTLKGDATGADSGNAGQIDQRAFHLGGTL